MNFNVKAVRYEAAASIQRALAAWGSQWLEPDLHNRTVLEIGAGTGVFTHYLIERQAIVTATDIAPRMLMLGKLRFPQVNWQIMDGWCPSLGAFDRLYSASLLQWAEHPEALLRRWRACLNPGGRFLALFFIEESLSELSSLHPYLSPIQWRTQQEWKRCFAHAGLRVLRSERWQRVYTFASARALLRQLHDSGATTVPRIKTGRLRTLLRCYDSLFAVDGGVRSTWTFCRVEGDLSA